MQGSVILKRFVTKSEALELIMNGKTIKCEMKDGSMRINKTNDDLFEAIVTSDKIIDGSREHIYTGDLKQFIKTINGVVGDCGLYIQEQQ